MMSNWRAKQIRKRGKASQTAGKTKGERCQTGKMKKFFASAARARKHDGYAEWHAKFKEMNSAARQ